MKTIKIDNGLNLQLIETEKFKTTTICMLIRRPLDKKEVTFNSLLPNILSRASKKYDCISKINAKLENMYGTIFNAQIVKMGEEQIIQFYLDILDDIDPNILEENFEFLHEIVLNPLEENGSFNEQFLKLEKENLKNRIESRINNKSDYLKLKCVEKMCENEPFSIYGDGYIDDFDKINGKNLYDHYQEILKTSCIEFVVIGKQKEDELIKNIKKYFSIKDRKEITIIKLPEIISSKKEKPTIEKEELDIVQGKICMGIRTNIKNTGMEFYNFVIMNEILGGGTNSKLFRNVREKESLCYNIFSFIYRFKSIVMIQCGVDKENFEKTIKLIGNEINNLSNGDVSQDELKNAKIGLLKNFESMKDYPSSIVNFYITQYMLGDKDNIFDVMEKIKKVTKDDVCNCAKKLKIDTIYLLS